MSLFDDNHDFTAPISGNDDPVVVPVEPAPATPVSTDDLYGSMLDRWTEWATGQSDDAPAVAVIPDTVNRTQLLDNEEALLDMMSQQMDEQLQTELAQADEAQRLHQVQSVVVADMMSRDDALRCESHYPGITQSVGGINAFTITPSRNGVHALRQALARRMTDMTVALSMEDASSEQPVLLSQFDEMVAKVAEATVVLNHEVKTFSHEALLGNDRVMIGDGMYLADIDLETMDAVTLATATATDVHELTKVIETIVVEYFSPKRQDIRSEYGIQQGLTVRALHAVVVHGTHLKYMAELHGQLEVLLTEIKPKLDVYRAAESVLHRDPTVLVDIIDKVREYCRIAKLYTRLCKHNLVFETAVAWLLGWREHWVALGR